MIFSYPANLITGVQASIPANLTPPVPARPPLPVGWGIREAVVIKGSSNKTSQAVTGTADQQEGV